MYANRRAQQQKNGLRTSVDENTESKKIYRRRINMEFFSQSARLKMNFHKMILALARSLFENLHRYTAPHRHLSTLYIHICMQ